MRPDPPRARAGRARQAYTLLEIAIALAVFGLLSSIVTLAISRAAVSSSEMRLRAAASDTLASLVERAGTTPFGPLAEGTFTRPDACPYDDLASCPRVLDRDLEVTWQSDPAFEPQSTAINAVTLTATTTLPDGSTVSARRTFTAPGLAWSGEHGWALVSFSGETPEGSAYLIDQDGAVVGVGPVLSGEASIQAQASACSPARPCRVALGPDGDLTSGSISLAAASALGPSGQVSLASGQVSAVSIVAYRSASVTARLVARNPDGWLSSPTVPGSVCLWLAFSDGLAQRSTPACNTQDPSQVTWSSYQAGTGGPVLGLPATAAVVSASGPSGTCPRIDGQKAFVAGSWSAQADCSSNTWGTPAAVAIDGVDQDAQDPFAVTAAGHALVDVIWQDPAAAGYAGQAGWSWPRDSGACAARAKCVPQPAPACAPGVHCASSSLVAPWLTSPAAGQWRVAVVTQPAGSGSLSLRVGSASGPATVTLSQPPVGTLRDAGGAVLGQGAVLGTLDDGQSVSLTYERGGLADDPFTVTLADASGSTRQVAVTVVAVPGAWQVRSAGTSAPQGASTPLVAWVVGTDGDPVTGVQVQAGSPPAGMSVTAGTSDGLGKAVTPVEVASTPAGSYALPLSAQTGDVDQGTARTATGNASITVTQSPATISVDDATIGQGRTGSARVSVLDAAGAPIADALVSVHAMQGAISVRQVTAVTGCRTGSDGRCRIPMTVGPRVAAGTYSLVGSSGTASGTGTLTVTASPGRVIAAGPVRVTQGTTTGVVITILDGAGQAAAGAVAQAEGDQGLAATVSGPADAQGKASVSVTAAADAPSGRHRVSVTVAEVTSTFYVTVVGVPAAVQADDTIVPQGRSATAVARVVDLRGDPVGSVVLGLPVTAGIDHPSVVRTDAEGTARIPVQARPGTATGYADLQVNDVNGASLGTVPILVSAGAVSAVALDSPAAGATSPLRILLQSASGATVSGASVTVAQAPSVLTLAPATSTSDSSGIVTLMASVRAGTSGGPRTVRLLVNGLVVHVAVRTTP